MQWTAGSRSEHGVQPTYASLKNTADELDVEAQAKRDYLLDASRPVGGINITATRRYWAIRSQYVCSIGNQQIGELSSGVHLISTTHTGIASWS